MKSWSIAAILLAFSAFAGAQSYPTKQIRLVVPAAPGGPNDIIARLLAQKMGEAWGQPVIVENRGGASGNIASTLVAKADPDGYTLLVTTASLAVNTALFKNPGYAATDFAPIAQVATTPNILVAKPGSESTLKEVLEKFRTMSISYGSPGSGTTPHLSAAYLLNVINKIEATHVPYKGAAPALNAAMTGEVQLSSVALPAAVELVKSGRLVGLGVTGATRSAAVPNVPTLVESGFPGLIYQTWVGVFAPAGTPAKVVDLINAEVQKSLSQPAFRERLANVGFDPAGGTVADFDKYFRSELARWAKIVQETKATPE